MAQKKSMYLSVYMNCSWHLIWIMSLLEGITVPLLALSAKGKVNELIVKMPSQGFLIGFIGTLIVSILLNYFLFKKMKLRINNSIIICFTSVVKQAVWGGLLLAIIFWLQNLIITLFAVPFFLKQFLLGFISASGSFLITGLMYQIVVNYFPKAGIGILTESETIVLLKMPFFTLAFLIGIYESIALPIIALWQLSIEYRMLVALISGATGGAIGSYLVIQLAKQNNVQRKLNLTFIRIPKD